MRTRVHWLATLVASLVLTGTMPVLASGTSGNTQTLTITGTSVQGTNEILDVTQTLTLSGEPSQTSFLQLEIPVGQTPVTISFLTVGGGRGETITGSGEVGTTIGFLTQAANVIRVIAVGGVPIQKTVYATAGSWHLGTFGEAMVYVPWIWNDSTALAKMSKVSFVDVPTSSWVDGYVTFADGQGFLHGFPNGHFSPNAAITGDQFLSVLYATAHGAGVAFPAPVNVPGTPGWAQNAVGSLAAYIDALDPGAFNGVLAGRELGLPITRAEAAEFLGFFLPAASASAMKTYTDWPDGSFTAEAAASVTSSVMEGVSATKFDPSGMLTRGEAAALLDRYFWTVGG